MFFYAEKLFTKSPGDEAKSTTQAIDENVLSFDTGGELFLIRGNKQIEKLHYQVFIIL